MHLPLPLSQQSPFTPSTDNDKTKVMYICPHAMYICDAGDVAPYCASESVIDESILHAFYVETHNELQWKGQECYDTDTLGIDVNNENKTVNSIITDNKSNNTNSKETWLDSTNSSNINIQISTPVSRWRTVAQELHKHLSEHHVILILSLATSSVFREQLLLLLFHSSVHVRSVIVLSDIVAESIGCGIHDGVVIHASPHYLCVGRVSDGNTIKYGNSRQGGALMKSLMPTNTTDECKTNNNCDVSEHKTTSDYAESSNVISNELYRSIETHDEIVKLFGYTSYVYAIERHLQRLQKIQSTSHLTSIRSLFERTKAKMSNKDMHTHTGTLERLFTQITENVESSVIILCGHAAHFQFIHDLCTSLVPNCNKEAIHTSNNLTDKEVSTNSSLARTSERKRERSEHLYGNMKGKITANEYNTQNKHYYDGNGETKAKDDNESKIYEVERESEGGAGTHNITDVDVEESEGSATNDDSHEEEIEEDSKKIENCITIDKMLQNQENDAKEKEEEANNKGHINESNSDEETTESESSVSDINSNETINVTDTNSSSSSSSSSENCFSELHLHPLPFCTRQDYKIEWLPLLGGSLLSQMSSHELKRLRIVSSEVSESNGAIVHWKAALEQHCRE